MLWIHTGAHQRPSLVPSQVPFPSFTCNLNLPSKDHASLFAQMSRDPLNPKRKAPCLFPA